MVPAVAASATQTPAAAWSPTTSAGTYDYGTLTSLGPGKSCTVTVSYAPAGFGQSDSGTLTATAHKAAATASLALLGASSFGGCAMRGAFGIPDC